MILHGFFRSSASYRVRIALALKGLDAQQRSYKLRAGDQRAPEYLHINPQGLVPALVLDDGRVLTQSLAMIEYLDETIPDPPLLPADAYDRARVRAAAQVIACDIHPVQNLKILLRVAELAGKEASLDWSRQTIAEGLEAFAALIADEKGPYCFGAAPTLADLCLVPQLVNARRDGAEWQFGRIAEVEEACMELPAFSETRPELQPDAG